jgi:hypothetical protein
MKKVLQQQEEEATSNNNKQYGYDYGNARSDVKSHSRLHSPDRMV